MSYKFLSLSDLPDQNNAHLQGLKRVFINHSDTNSALTQFAYGVMESGHESGMHLHPTMDEYFYFLSGSGTCRIDDQTTELNASSFLRITAGTAHNIINNGTETMKFIYFGIAV